MKQAARTECYRKCTDSKLAYTVSEWDKKHAKELHNLLTKDPTLVNMLNARNMGLRAMLKWLWAKMICLRSEIGEHLMTPD
jgi:hypothetical protein